MAIKFGRPIENKLRFIPDGADAPAAHKQDLVVRMRLSTLRRSLRRPLRAPLMR